MMKDSISIQLASLYQFANSLGYTYEYSDNCNRHGRFVIEDLAFSSHPNKVISFIRMVELHNLSLDDTQWLTMCGKGKSFGFINEYLTTRANGAKLVEKVFLHVSKGGEITCHKHWVKFVKDTYWYIFKNHFGEEIPNVEPNR